MIITSNSTNRYKYITKNYENIAKRGNVMSIVDYSVLRNEDYGTNPPFKSDETGLHGDAEFPIAVYCELALA